VISPSDTFFTIKYSNFQLRYFSQVLQRYYVQYLSGYDGVSLNQLLQPLQTLSEEESIILSSLCNSIGGLSIKQGIIAKCSRKTSVVNVSNLI
jgi:hypothetical protein